MRIFVVLVGASLVLIFLWQSVFAHPGRTDSSGCHTCRTNCPSWGLYSGEYHCHQAKALPQPEEPIHSRKEKGGRGYTVPAPEYKIPKQQPPVSNNNISKGQETTTQKVVVSGSVVLGIIGWLLKKKFFG